MKMGILIFLISRFFIRNKMKERHKFISGQLFILMESGDKLCYATMLLSLKTIQATNT